MAMKAAALYDSGEPCGLEANAAKYLGAEAGFQTCTRAVTTPGGVLKYAELFPPLRRLDGQDVQLKGGYKPIAAVIHAGGAIPVIGDIDCPSSRMFFLNTSAFRMADVIGTEWADMDGATFDRVVDKDAIEGYIRKYWNLATIQRNANGVIEDLEDIPLDSHA